MAMLTRQHNRQFDEIRSASLTLSDYAHSQKALIVRIGETQVLCSASLTEDVPSHVKGSGRGWVTAEYGMLPSATHTRYHRERKGGVQGRAHEIQRLIGRSLRSMVDLAQLGERQIIVDCDVLKADGGTRTASITGAAATLRLLLNALIQQGLCTEAVHRPMVAAVSVGLLDRIPLLDLDYEEDSRCTVDCNIVMNEALQFVEIQCCSERATYSEQQLMEMLQLAHSGIQHLLAMQREFLDTTA